MKSKARSVLVAVAVFAGLGAIAAPAIAQDKDEIIVVPYGIQRYDEGQRTASGARVQTLTLSRYVSTEGLDLRRDSDVDALYERIEYTAREACRDLDRAADISTTSDRACVRDAVRGAEPQVSSLVARCRY